MPWKIIESTDYFSIYYQTIISLTLKTMEIETYVHDI